MLLTKTRPVNFLTEIKPPDPLILQEGIGVANGTFGELLQGALQGDNNHFLVTLPIQKFSRAVFTPNAATKRITVTPSNKSKSLALLQKLVEHYGLSIGGHLLIESELAEGKGRGCGEHRGAGSHRHFEGRYRRGAVEYAQPAAGGCEGRHQTARRENHRGRC